MWASLNKRGLPLEKELLKQKERKKEKNTEKHRCIWPHVPDVYSFSGQNFTTVTSKTTELSAAVTMGTSASVPDKQTEL